MISDHSTISIIGSTLDFSIMPWRTRATVSLRGLAWP